MRKTKTSSEDTRIRHYVMNLMYRNAGVSVEVPSTYKLAETLGVARSTVLLALARLRGEGYLITRPGAATRTNPCRLHSPGETRRPLIGVAVNRGDNFYYGKENWHAAAVTGEALTEAGFHVRLTAGVEEQYLDGLVAVNADSRLIKEARGRLPVVTVGRPENPGEAGVGFSYRAALEELGRGIATDGPPSLLLLASRETPWEERLFELAGQHFPGELLELNPRHPDLSGELERLLAERNPGGILAWPNLGEFLFSELRRLDRTCQVVSFREMPDSANFPGWFFRSPYEKAAERAARMMQAILSGRTVAPEVMDIELIRNSKQ